MVPRHQLDVYMIQDIHNLEPAYLLLLLFFGGGVYQEYSVSAIFYSRLQIRYYLTTLLATF